MPKKTKGGSMDFKVTASGLDKVDKDAKKAGSSFNTLDKNARSTDRAMKGVSNMSSNTTKNFSKMSQGITGGLVPAYATLAAQLFALDALFRFLREAADFRVLQQGQELFAASTGRAMRTLSKDIQMATSAQITFKEASQSAAIGLAAGLSPTQLNELGKAARTVSVALGRDTTDSFNRLVRGVTKAEPELLDELGIILRLEEATTRYAASLGLNKNQLTTFQKSQAVANEVLRQSEERYGAIADRIGDDSVNQLNKLMVAFDEVLNKIREFIGPIAEFFGKFLTENIASAAAAVTLFASSITGGLIQGALPKIDYEKSGLFASQVAGSGDLQETAMMSKDRIKRLSTPGAATEADIKAYEKAIKAKESKMLKFEKNSRQQHKRTVQILKAQRQRMVADASIGFERMSATFKAELYEMQAEHGRVMGAMKFAGLQFGKAMNAIMATIGYIGIAIMLYQMGKMLVNMFREVDERQEAAIEKTKEHASAMNSLADEIQKTANFYKEDLFAGAEDRIRAVGGAFQSADIAARIDQVETAIFRLGPDSDATKSAIAGLMSISYELGTFNPKFAEFARMLAVDPLKAIAMYQDEMQEFSAGAVKSGQAVDALTRAQANFDKQFNAFIQKQPKVQFQDIIMSLETMARHQKDLASASNISAAEQEVFNARLEVTEIRMRAFASLFEMSAARMIEFGEARRAALKGETALFGSKEDIQNSFKLATQVNKILQKREDIFGAQLAIDNMQEGTEKDIAQQRLNFSKQLLKEEKERLAMMMAGQNKFIKTFGQAAEAFGNDLADALGKLFRGDKIDLEEFGKKMTKVLTDSLAEAISNRIMRIAYRGTPLDPNVQMAKYTKEVEQMLEQKGRDTAAKIQGAGDDLSTNTFNALQESGSGAAVNIYNGMQTGGADASKTIYDRMILAADYHGYKIQSAERDLLVAEGKFLTIEKQKVDDEIIQLQGRVDKGLPGMIEERDNLLTSLYDMAPGEGNFRRQMVPFAGVYGDPGNFERLLNEIFPDGIRGPLYSPDESFGYSVIAGDIRDDVANDFGDMVRDALTAIENNDVAGMRKVFAEYQSTGSQHFRDVLANHPEGAKVTAFFEALGLNLTVLDNLNEEVDHGEKTLKDLNTQIDGLTETSKTFDNQITDVNAKLANMPEVQDPTPETIPGATKSGFTGNTDGTFNPENKSDGTGTGTPVGTGGGTGGYQSFGEQTADMFPALMGAMEDGGFGQSVMTFGTVITQFGTLIAQGLALSGKQEEAADIMLEVAKIQLALAAAELAYKAFQGFDAFMNPVTRYGGVLSPSGKSFDVGGIASGPESGYNATLHGTEAVVPLGNDRSIPVKLDGAAGTNNVNVTVNVDQSGTETFLTGDGAKQLGAAMAAVAQDTIAKEQRAGGLLSSI